MNQHFFCSELSNQVGEDLLGSATPSETYILIECPFPWQPEALDSKWVPENLRELAKATKKSGLSARFLLINRETARLGQLKSDPKQVLIYQRSPEVFCGGYQRWEGTVERLEEVAPLVEAHLQGESPFEAAASHRAVRDLFICVHGMRDRCCGKYGMPFYRSAVSTVAQMQEELGDREVRLWQTSHIGGHRFAPTLIDFPTGRYYGRLNSAVLRSLLLQSGDLPPVVACYRGWSLLPPWLQTAERELIERYGWQWFDCRVAYQTLACNADKQYIEAEISAMRAPQHIDSYRVELVKDSCKTVCLKVSCGVSSDTEQVKYKVKSFVKLTPLAPALTEIYRSS